MWRAVCPVARLPPGQQVAVLLGGVRVLVRSGPDGLSASSQDGAAYDVRVEHGVIEVALRTDRLSA